MTGVIPIALSEASKRFTESNIKRMLPDLEDLDEQQLRILLDRVETVQSINICPYSGRAFGGYGRYVMFDEHTFKVGTEKYMAIRAARDGEPYEELGIVRQAIMGFYQPLYDERTRKEAEVAAERARRKDLFDKVSGVAEILQRLNSVDGLSMLPAAFDATLSKIVSATKDMPKDAIGVYLEERALALAESQQRTNEEPATQTAEPDVTTGSDTYKKRADPPRAAFSLWLNY
jgi:hypothetical protein